MPVEFPTPVLGIFGQYRPGHIPIDRAGQADETVLVVRMGAPRLFHGSSPSRTHG